MYISSTTDPVIPLASAYITDLAKEAIEWFDQTRVVNQATHTIFTFKILRYIDKKATSCGTSFFVQNKYTYPVNFDKCIDFDQDQNKENILSHTTNSIDHIVSVKILTQPFIALLTESFPQEIQKIKLKVEMFDPNNNIFKQWVSKLYLT